MTAATNSVKHAFQKVMPSRIDATMPVGSNRCGIAVASAEGETKLPVTLTMTGSRRERNHSERGEM